MTFSETLAYVLKFSKIFVFQSSKIGSTHPYSKFPASSVVPHVKIKPKNGLTNC